MKKKVLFLSIICFSLFCLSGCSASFWTGMYNLMSSTNDTKSTYEQKAINYIENKYNKKFEYLWYESDAINGADAIACSTDDIPKSEHINVYLYGFLKNELHDDYAGFIFKKKLEQYITELTISEFRDIKVYSDRPISWLSDDLNEQSSLDLFFEEIDKGYTPYIKIYICKEDIDTNEFQTKTENIEQQLKNEGRFDIIWIMLDTNTFNSLTEENNVDTWATGEYKFNDGIVYENNGDAIFWKEISINKLL